MDQFEYAQHQEVSQRYKAGANWFYWIAGLTMITSIIAHFGGEWGFLIGLGVTQVIDGFGAYFAAELGSAPKVIALVLDVIVTGVFVLFGYLANKKYLWAYMLGMVVFLLDGMLFLLFQDLLGIIVHVVVLFFMFRGYQAGRELLSLEKTMAQQSAEHTPQPEPAV